MTHRMFRRRHSRWRGSEAVGQRLEPGDGGVDLVQVGLQVVNEDRETQVGRVLGQKAKINGPLDLHGGVQVSCEVVELSGSFPSHLVALVKAARFTT